MKSKLNYIFRRYFLSKNLQVAEKVGQQCHFLPYKHNQVLYIYMCFFVGIYIYSAYENIYNSIYVYIYIMGRVLHSFYPALGFYTFYVLMQFYFGFFSASYAPVYMCMYIYMCVFVGHYQSVQSVWACP